MRINELQDILVKSIDILNNLCTFDKNSVFIIKGQ